MKIEELIEQLRRIQFELPNVDVFVRYEPLMEVKHQVLDVVVDTDHIGPYASIIIST